MQVRVDSALRLEARRVPARLLERLRGALSFPNPAYLSRMRLGLRPSGAPEKICLLDESEDLVRLPRGAIYLLRDLAQDENLPVTIDDQRALPNKSLEIHRELALRDYQAAAVDKLIRSTQGYVVVPCGGGKSVLGLGAIARLRTPTLVLVHTIDLAHQWRREIQEKLGIEPGLIGDGTAVIAPITVAVVQALLRWDPPALDQFLGAFGLLIIDEAHHTPSSIFRSIVDRCPARFRLGLTATPERADGLEVFLDLFLGRPLATVTHAELMHAGVLTLPEVRVMDTKFCFPYQSATDFAPMLNALARDSDRNALIADTVRAEAAAGEICLVLTGRVDHALALGKALQAAGLEVGMLTGAVRPATRAQHLAAAREGRLNVLVATTLADEGLDLPRLSRVFLVFPSRARARTTQRLGRLMRPHPEKRSAVLYDFVDRLIPILRRHHIERRKLYSEVLAIPASAMGSQRTAAVIRDEALPATGKTITPCLSTA